MIEPNAHVKLFSQLRSIGKMNKEQGVDRNVYSILLNAYHHSLEEYFNKGDSSNDMYDFNGYGDDSQKMKYSWRVRFCFERLYHIIVDIMTCDDNPMLKSPSSISNRSNFIYNNSSEAAQKKGHRTTRDYRDGVTATPAIEEEITHSPKRFDNNNNNSNNHNNNMNGGSLHGQLPQNNATLNATNFSFNQNNMKNLRLLNHESNRSNISVASAESSGSRTCDFNGNSNNNRENSDGPFFHLNYKDIEDNRSNSELFLLQVETMLQSLEHCLEHKLGFILFELYCNESICCESILFYKECIKYRNALTQEGRNKLGSRIITEFISHTGAS